MTLPSVEKERLACVQEAARHVLACADAGIRTFKTMEIFPPDVAPAKHNSPEYNWRSQLAWVWAKAGYMSQTWSGKGLKRHWNYELLPAGRPALARLASDPASASFYVKMRRTGINRNQEGFKPPELRLLPDSSNSPFDVESESDDGSADDEGADGREEETQAGDDGGVPTFIENITVVLERISAKLEAIESKVSLSSSSPAENAVTKEIRAQSEIMLDVAGKFDATREDLGAVSGELVGALVKSKAEIEAHLDERLKLHHAFIGAGLRTLEQKAGFDVDEKKLAAALDALLDAKIRQCVSVAVHSAIEEQRLQPATYAEVVADVVAEKMTASKVIQKVFTEIVQGEVASYGKVLQANLSKEFASSLDNMTVSLSVPDDVKKSFEEIKEVFGGIREHCKSLSDGIDSLDDKFFDTLKGYRTQTSELTAGCERMIESAESIVEGAKAVAAEMIRLSRESVSNLPPEYTFAKSNEAIAKFDEVRNANKGRASALGAGLVRPIESSGEPGKGSIILMKNPENNQDDMEEFANDDG